MFSAFARFIDAISEVKRSLPYHFYFNKLFTSFDLLNHPFFMGYGDTGTVWESPPDKTCPLSSLKVSEEMVRRSIELKINKEDNNQLVRWTDNNAITMTSNMHGLEPISKVQRYEKTVISVRCSNIVSPYNKFLGGTDQIDQNVNAYRIGCKSKEIAPRILAHHSNSLLVQIWRGGDRCRAT